MEYQNHQMENKCSFESSFRWKKILYWARHVIFPKRAKLWPHKKGNNISFYKNATCGNNISKSDYSLTSALRLFWKIHIAFLLFFSFPFFFGGGGGFQKFSNFSSDIWLWLKPLVFSSLDQAHFPVWTI